jgi:hypothetical protein
MLMAGARGRRSLKLPISACLQNEQANFATLRFTNHDHASAKAVAIVIPFHRAQLRKYGNQMVTIFSWQPLVDELRTFSIY